MISRLKPYIDYKEILAALSIWKKNSVEKFEMEFAKKVNQKYALVFPYGRTALMFLLEGLGLKNKEIICPSYTCVVVPHAIVYSKNIPVFVDSNEIDFNMDLDKVEGLINENTGAVISTSIFGNPVNLDKLRKIKEKNPSIFIIQDCAHSFTAKWNNDFVHTEGVAAVFAMNISKHMNSIFGGMITTNDEKLYERIKKIRNEKLNEPSITKSIKRFIYLLAVYPTFWEPVYTFVNYLERKKLLGGFVDKFDQGIVMPNDYLDRMTEIEARVGIVQLKKIDEIIQHRIDAAKNYSKKLSHLKNLKLPLIIEGSTVSHYVPRTKYRKEIMEYCISEGIQIGELIEYSIPELKYYKELTNSKYNCPVSSQMATDTINLPVSSGLKATEKVIESLNKFFEKKDLEDKI